MATPPMNSISYSVLETLVSQYSDMSEGTDCTFISHDEMAFGDNYKQGGRQSKLRQLYPAEGIDPFSMMKYDTPTQHELGAPYEKFTAERFEAEYDYCMRWAADKKHKSIRIIPFESNFFSVVRLIFQGRNWVLDCANYDGQYDYCGWLPSTTSPKQQNNLRLNMKQLMTDSSLDNVRQTAGGGGSVHSSDTCYDLNSLITDYSDNESEFTKDPIEESMYLKMGPSETKESFDEVDFPVKNGVKQIPILFPDNVIKVRSRSSSLNELFYDLVELDQLFAKQVVECQKGTFVELDSDYIECLHTAQSFSTTMMTTQQSSEEYDDKKPKTVINTLSCLKTKKLTFQTSVEFFKNLIRMKK